MVGNPNPCPDCGGQLFTAIWSLYAKKKKRDENGNVVTDEDGRPRMVRDEQAKPDSHGENGTDIRQDGVECVNCGTIQFHRGVPDRHESKHGLPQGAVDNRPSN